MATSIVTNLFDKTLPAYPRLEWRKTTDLRPHPALIDLKMLPSPARLAGLSDVGEKLFGEPLKITDQGYVLDGNARYEIARLSGRDQLLCVVYLKTEDEALESIILEASRNQARNTYCRILLALRLEPNLRKRARANQILAGKGELNPKINEVDRVDTLSQIARLAGSCRGNVNKVKYISAYGIQRLKDEAKLGTISINAAKLMSELNQDDQQMYLVKGRRVGGPTKKINCYPNGNSQDSGMIRKCLLQVKYAVEKLKAEQAKLRSNENISRLTAKLDTYLLEIEQEL